MRSIPHPAFLAPARPDAAGPARPRRIVAILAGALALALAWAGGSTYYLVFHDELLAGFVAGQRAMQRGYEARVEALQWQIDRSASERILAREGFEGRLAALAERQELIEKRQGLVSGLGGALPEAPAGEAPAPARPRPQPAKPTPIADDLPDLPMRGSDRTEVPESRPDLRLARLEGGLDRLSDRQSQALGGIAARASRNAERFRTAILRAGLEPARFESPERGVGGPFVPATADAFDVALAQAQAARGDEERLARAVATLPLRRPLPEDALATSEFGTRLDPFTRALALHTGIDLRADHGTPARATAAGRVTAAEYAGGYGNMVEIDHGHGLVTRYAHLAGFSVAPGQRVEAGAIVGRVGSTGRSTGSHLHYETRIDGEPVDPTRFLQAGAVLDDPEKEDAPAPSWLAAWENYGVATRTLSRAPSSRARRGFP